MNPPEELVKLIKIKWAALLPISPKLLESLTIEAHRDLWHDVVYEKLKLTFWGEWAEPTVIAYYPEDWWEAFKDRWFPRWLLNRYPVKFFQVKVQGGVAFPKSALIPGSTKIWRYGSAIPPKDPERD